MWNFRLSNKIRPVLRVHVKVLGGLKMSITDNKLRWRKSVFLCVVLISFTQLSTLFLHEFVEFVYKKYILPSFSL